jgi:hypothetical protein
MPIPTGHERPQRLGRPSRGWGDPAPSTPLPVGSAPHHLPMLEPSKPVTGSRATVVEVTLNDVPIFEEGVEAPKLALDGRHHRQQEPRRGPTLRLVGPGQWRRAGRWISTLGPTSRLSVQKGQTGGGISGPVATSTSTRGRDRRTPLAALNAPGPSHEPPAEHCHRCTCDGHQRANGAYRRMQVAHPRTEHPHSECRSQQGEGRGHIGLGVKLLGEELLFAHH